MRTEKEVFLVGEHGKRWQPMAELVKEYKSPHNKLSQSSRNLINFHQSIRILSKAIKENLNDSDDKNPKKKK